MKRIIAVVLTLTIALAALSGCELSNKLTAFGLYTKAVNTIREAGGFEAECAAVIDLALLSMDVDMSIKQNGGDSEIVVSMLGDEVSTTTIVGDMVYVDAAGIKTRYPKPVSESSGNEVSALPKLAEDLFTDIEIVKDENGGKSLTVFIGADVLDTLFGSAMSSDVIAMTFEDAGLTMYFDPDNNIESMHVDCDAKMDLAGFEMSAVMSLDYTFINLGTAPEINAPENADDYVLVDAPETDNT